MNANTFSETYNGVVARPGVRWLNLFSPTGSYHVILDEKHFVDLLKQHVTPPTATVSYGTQRVVGHHTLSRKCNEIQPIKLPTGPKVKEFQSV